MPYHLQVSTALRGFQVFCAVTYCILAGGIIFGFAALKPVLVSEGVYSQYCTPKEIEDNVEICSQQDIKLNMIFTTGAVSTNVAALLVGRVLDKEGPRVCGVVGSVFLSIGALLLAYASEIFRFDGYLIGYVFLALGGPFVYISSFQLSNAFPHISGTILAMLTGAFDSSSAVFFIYRIIYQNSDGKIYPRIFFKYYLFVPIFILLAQMLVLPKDSYKTVSQIAKIAEEGFDEDAAAAAASVFDDDEEEQQQQLYDPDNLNSSTSREEQAWNGATAAIGKFPSAAAVASVQIPTDETFEDSLSNNIHQSMSDENTSLLYSNASSVRSRRPSMYSRRQSVVIQRKANISGIWGALHNKSLSQQVHSLWFLFILLFTTLQMLRINYFVATVRSQYTFLFKSVADAVALNGFFDVALPAGGVIAVPFIGVLLDNFSSFTVLVTLVSTATFISIMGILTNKIAAYLGIVLFVAYRPFYYTTMSDLTAKVFGFETFGTVYGLIFGFAGVFNFMQTPLDIATHHTFNGDPRPVNIGLMIALLIFGIALTWLTKTESIRLKRNVLETEAERTRPVPLPSSNAI